MRRALTLLLALGVSACGSPARRAGTPAHAHKPAPTFAPPPRRVMLQGGMVEGRVALWEWLQHDAIEPPGLGAYGYVLFGRKLPEPTEELGFRALRTCEALQSVLQEAAGASAPGLFTTFWPLVESQVASGPVSCKDAVARYDFHRVSGLVSCLKVGGKAGPVLVAQPEAHRGDASSVRRLVLDLSTAPSIGIASDTLFGGVERWVGFTRTEPSGGWLSAVKDDWTYGLASLLTGGSIEVGSVSKLEGCR